MKEAKLDAIALVEATRRGDAQSRNTIAAAYEGDDLTELVAALAALAAALLTDLDTAGADVPVLLDGYRSATLAGDDD